MDTQDVLNYLWTKYISSNDEKLFHNFIKDFVSYWEPQLIIEWHDAYLLPTSWMWNNSSSDVKHDAGPHLSSLPDELLPAIAKFIFLAKDETEKGGLDTPGLKKLEMILRCLIIICRNFDNIPFVASCEYVSLMVGIAATVIHQQVAENESTDANTQLELSRATFLSCFCCFLECLYDPYLTWRDFVKGCSQTEPCNLPLHSALLHMEVIPFIYDCFQTAMMEKMPWLCSNLLHILGGTISAAQSAIVCVDPITIERRQSVESTSHSLYTGHNGLRAICPATINVLMGVITRTKADESVCLVAFKCFTIMAHVLQKSSPEERQIEVAMILQLYHDAIKTLMSEVKHDEEPTILLHAISTLSSLLDVIERVHDPIQESLIEIGFPELIVSLLEESKEFSSSAQQKLAVICVHSFNKLLSGNHKGKEKISKAGGNERLFNALVSIGQLSEDLLKALFLMAVDGNMQNHLQNAEVVVFLLGYMNIMDTSRQKKLSISLRQLCTSHFLSKVKACSESVIRGICQALSYHSNGLCREAAVELIHFLEDLMQHSVTPLELKELFHLLRNSENNLEQQLPYRAHILRALSSAARKGDHIDCSCYLDIQADTDGISVPGIKKWPGIGNCLAFHAWVRLESDEESCSNVKPSRRQLFSFYTSGGSGFEIFFAGNGDLTVAVSSNKDYSAATVSDIPLTDGQWHCLYICHMAARRPFGQNHLTVYIDGTQRLSACLKFPSLTDPYIYCHIGSIVQRSGVVGGKKVTGKTTEKDDKDVDVLILPKAIYSSLSYLVPSYLGFPMQVPYGSSYHPQQDPPHVKSVPAGMQDTIWGLSSSLKGHLGQVALFHDCLSGHQIKALHTSGPDYWAVNAVDDTMELTDLTNKLVLCYSPNACWNHSCPDLAPGGKHNGHVEGTLCCTRTVKDALNGIGGILVLIPLLENATQAVDCGSTPDLSLSLSPLPQPSSEKHGEDKAGPEELDGWEVLPRSSFSDWKLEQNPVSGFLTLLRNIITRSALNQENILKNNAMAIIGSLLIQSKAELIDVNVLMAVQLLVEMAHEGHSSKGSPSNLLQTIHRHLLFDFRIWSRSQFQIRIGHLQYVSTVVKEDRRYFRKNYGVQFLFDVVRRHYNSESVVDTSEDGVLLSVEDLSTVRRALLGLVKYYMQKDINVREVNSLLGFLVSVRDECLVSDSLEMLISIMGNKKCRDQIFLLLYERHAADILYGLIVDKLYTMELKQKVLRLLSILLRTDRVRERNKRHLRLQDVGPNHGNSSTIGLYPGLICLWQEQGFFNPSMEVVMMLLDQMLSTDSPTGYAGTLSLLSSLSLHGDLNIRIEAARKTLTTIFMIPTAAKHFAIQVGWQECISRLLIRKPINGNAEAGDEGSTDLISFGDDQERDDDRPVFGKEEIIAEDVDEEYEMPLSSLPRLATSVSDAAYYIENEVKEVAETVTSAVADNIYTAADNISSAVASAYSVIRQKTLDIQGPSSPRSASPRFFPRSPFSLSSLRPEFDGISLSEKRSQSCSSEDEDESSVAYESRCDNTTGDSVSLTSAISISIASDTERPTLEEDKVIEEGVRAEEIDEKAMDSEAIRLWKALDEERIGDKEEELCYLVVNILFTILWRGIEGSGKDAWKERGQVLSCINLVGLNNELLCSHLELRRHLLELALTASLSDLRGGLMGGGQPMGGGSGDPGGGGQGGSTGGPRRSEAAVENAAFLMRWVYDLVVLDPNEDGSKKASIKLLNGVLGHLEILLVFREGPNDEWTEMAKIAFGILLCCAANDDLELCAMATAKLHALVQTRIMNDPAEGGFLLYSINKILQKDIEKNSQDRYSFLIPVVKALLEKLSPVLGLGTLLSELPRTRAGPVFFEDFRHYCQSHEWTSFVGNTIRGLHDAYQEALTGELTDSMNTFWAECYEASKVASNRRVKEVAESRLRFEAQIMDYFRSRQIEDIARYSNLLNQEKNYDLLVGRKWHHLKQNLISPRGAWRERSPKERHWKLSRHENSSRMRLKLCPNLDFNSHTEASNLRDNSANIKRNSVGWVTRLHTDDIPHSMNISAAVCPESEEENATDEEIRALSDVDLEGVKEGGKEKMVLSQECDLVTLMSVVKGRLEVTTAHISFTDLSPVKEDVERQDFKWSISRLKDMYPRRYNLRRSAIEFCLTDQTNYFLNFTTKVRNKVYSSILSLRPPNLSTHHARSPADLLKASGLTQKWVAREINNFDYLMQLNTIAGRTYNDLSQYPVFPWILADYISEKLDLESPESFRDLSKPIGVVNPKNEAEVKAKYDSFEDPSGTIAKFHYGTHYSNSAGVLHYLVRVEPFTTLHIELQSGRFDVADRQFHSIPQTWKLLMDNPNDVKELIPEFFYMPEFLANHNGFDLGHLQGSKEQVNDVTLPKWASSPDDFIHKHRDALESEYVSAHLHEWIDLIFGYKQKGPKAVEALNVFYYCSYEGAVDLDAIANSFEREAVEGMINNFGQTPSQLLHEPHPKRMPIGDALQRMLTRRPDLSLYLERICSISVQLSNERDPLVFVSTPRSPPRGSFLQTSLPDTVVAVTRSGVIGLHSWVPHGSANTGLSFNLDIDPSISSTKYRRKLPSTFHPGLSLSSHMFAVSHDGKLLYSVGHWDASLHVYSLSRNKTIAHAIRHFDLVTCVALDECGSYLITGSRDTTCVVWDVSGFGVGGGMAVASSTGSVDLGSGGSMSGGNSSGVGPSSGISGAALIPVHKLHGHDAPVTCVAILTQLDIAASGSMDGTVNVYTIQEGQYIRTLPSLSCNLSDEITNLSISNHGHIAFAAREKGSYSLHVYTVNGHHLGSEPVPGRVTGLAIIGGGQNYKHHVVTTDDAGDLTLRALIRLKPVFEHPLHVPIESLAITNGNTHLLLPARDGQLIVIGLLPGSI